MAIFHHAMGPVLDIQPVKALAETGMAYHKGPALGRLMDSTVQH